MKCAQNMWFKFSLLVKNLLFITSRALPFSLNIKRQKTNPFAYSAHAWTTHACAPYTPPTHVVMAWSKRGMMMFERTESNMATNRHTTTPLLCYNPLSHLLSSSYAADCSAQVFPELRTCFRRVVYHMKTKTQMTEYPPFPVILAKKIYGPRDRSERKGDHHQ